MTVDPLIEISTSMCCIARVLQIDCQHKEYYSHISQSTGFSMFNLLLFREMCLSKNNGNITTQRYELHLTGLDVKRCLENLCTAKQCQVSLLFKKGV